MSMKILTPRCVSVLLMGELLLPIDPIWIVILVGRSEGSVGQILLSLFFTVTVDERVYSKHAVSKGK